MTNSSSWSYADNDFGPRTWHERYKVAKGNLQSPINIDTVQVVAGDNVGPIQFQYVNIHNSTLTNDGRHLQVTVIKNESAVSDGPLSDRYQLAVIRFHWGNESDTGSEHAIDGQKYPLEVQLIHWNKDRYKNIGEAMVGDNGLCIIGLLYQVSDEENTGLKAIVDLISRDEKKGCFSLEVKSTIDPNKFITDMTNYWTYQGSLTTPPLTENVTWVVSQNIMSLSEKQIKAFRSIRNSSGVSMADHYRPLCPQNERPVRLCTCVVKSPSSENHRSLITNHTIDDAVYDEKNAVQQYNGWNNLTENTANEEDSPPQNQGHSTNEKYCDAEEDAETAFQSLSANSCDKDKTSDDAGKALDEQAANSHVYQEECNDTGKTLYDQDTNWYDEDEKLPDKEDDLHDQDKTFLDNSGVSGQTSLQQRAENRHENEEECYDASANAEKTLHDQDAKDEEREEAETTLCDKDTKLYGSNEVCDDTEKTWHEERTVRGDFKGCDNANKGLDDQGASCQESDEERNVHEKVVHKQDQIFPGNDVECDDIGKNNGEESNEAEIAFDQDTDFYANNEDCGHAEKPLHGPDATSHGNVEGCDDPDILQDQETASHIKDKKYDSTDDALRDEDTTFGGNNQGWDDASKAVHNEDTSAHGNSEKCENAENGLLDEDVSFLTNNEECEDVGKVLHDEDTSSHVSQGCHDERKVVDDPDANCHENDKECDGAVEIQDQGQGRETNSHGNNDEVNDASDELGKAVCDENANISNTQCHVTVLNSDQHPGNLESENNDHC